MDLFIAIIAENPQPRRRPRSLPEGKARNRSRPHQEVVSLRNRTRAAEFALAGRSCGNAESMHPFIEPIVCTVSIAAFRG